MPKAAHGDARLHSPTSQKGQRSDRVSMAQLRRLARVNFKAIEIASEDMMPMAVFIEHARITYTVLAICAGMVAKSSDELAAIFETAGLDNDGDDLIGILKEIMKAKNWFTGGTRLLESVEARVLVAAARLAT